MTQRGFNYLYSGKLTGTVNDVPKAQEYLTDVDMTQFMHDVAPPVVHIRWNLHSDGQTYDVHAVATRGLTEQEIKDLTDWVKGQNSDGMGEGFEQQDFATIGGSRDSWGTWDEDEDEETMVSFDWCSNETQFVPVVPSKGYESKWQPVAWLPTGPAAAGTTQVPGAAAQTLTPEQAGDLAVAEGARLAAGGWDE